MYIYNYKYTAYTRKLYNTDVIFMPSADCHVQSRLAE